jgi:hypothetical protein
MDGDSDRAGAGGMKRRLESRLQAPEKSNLGLCEQDLLYLPTDPKLTTKRWSRTVVSTLGATQALPQFPISKPDQPCVY